MKVKFTLGLLLASSALFSYGQGTFQNLDFEAAFPNIQPNSPPGMYAVTTLLPGWTVYSGTNQQSLMGYNLVSYGETFTALFGFNPLLGFTSINGRYTLSLYGGVTDPDASIRQTGLVPSSTAAILFAAQGGLAGPLLVSLGGKNIPIYALSTGPNYTLYGGDVSAFAGQVAQLEFSAPEGYSGNNYWNIDSIVFSATPIPEPATEILLLAGGILLAIKPLRQIHKK